MSEFEPPKKSVGDAAIAVVRGGLGAIPFAGQAAMEVFAAVVKPPFERRTVEWQESIGEAVRDLAEKQPRIAEELAANEVFIDTLVQASQAAIRTGNAEKWAALRNAVVNSALPGAPDESRQSIFVRLVDSLTALHLRLLAFLDDPDAWFRTHGREKPRVKPQMLWPMVAAAFPDLVTEEILCERVCRDLHEHGLLIASSLRKNVNRFPYRPEQPREEQDGYRFSDELPADTAVSIAGSPTAYRHWTTELGRQFIAFISEPPHDVE